MGARHILVSTAAAIAVLSTACAKPCAPLPQSDTVKKLGVVLDGGNLCKDENDTYTIDYPKVSAKALQGTYSDGLGKNGWKTETATDYMLLATKDKDLLLVTTAGKSKERGVPFAVVKHCDDDVCSKSMRELFDASKKYAK